MADKSKIEWTEASWNPIVGCSIVSKGCTNCYAMKQAHRIQAMTHASGKQSHYDGTTKLTKGGPVWTGKVALAPDHIFTQPLRWSKPRTIFVNSMSDLFHEDVPDEWIDRAFAIMALCPQHTFQVLTKRAERMREVVRRLDAAHAEAVMHMEMIPAARAGSAMMDAFPHYVSSLAHPSQHGIWPLPNVWLGVSAEDQTRYDERKEHLRATPAAVRFLSIEPLLGPIGLDLSGLSQVYRPINWVIVGGESGTNARPMHPDWARSIRDQCQAAGVPLFFKQWGEYDGHNYPMRVGKKVAGRRLDGREHNEMPEVRR